MNEYYAEIDNKPEHTIVIGGRDGVRTVPKNDETDDYSPRLPAQSAAQAIQAILSAPAPVPQRDAELIRRQPVTVQHTRHVGDNVKATATDRMIGAAMAVGLATVAISILGVILTVVGVADGRLILLLCALSIAFVTVYYIEKSFSHSQAGVELARNKSDHKLDMAHEQNRHSVEALHEQNRHSETLAAITGDIEIKLRVLDLAAGTKQLADRQRRLGGE